MKMNQNNDDKTTYRGIGFCGALTIAFVVLKLCGVIHWHWLWVLAPLWIPFAIALAIILVLAVIYIIRDAMKGGDKHAK